MVEKDKKVLASPAMGKRGAEHLRARDCSPGGPSRANSKQQQGATAIGYKGVRVREWGKWVTEISDTQTKDRIWLGSFDTEEMAARAYDSAVVSLKGSNAAGLNFPDSPPRVVSKSREPNAIKAAALAAAYASASKAIPLVSSKKKKKVSPDQGESCNHEREDSAPSALKDPGRPATLEEIHRWIDNDFV